MFGARGALKFGGALRAQEKPPAEPGAEVLELRRDSGYFEALDQPMASMRACSSETGPRVTVAAAAARVATGCL